ncbi:F-box protein At5g51370-like [Andrographis paniculata]|uniref:F-box protein At5g51370-like n=1 Tax=Andrographis paniculata TaxID=175694 RepID=UPI0021E925D3|nr:F-box protein At5g51370-like [Andrographis paniculata]
MERKCRTVTSSSSPEKENLNSNWLKTKKALNNVLFTMRLQSKESKSLNHPQRMPLSESPFQIPKSKTLDTTTTTTTLPADDVISLLSDEILLKILSKLPKSQRNSISLVSKRWLNLQGSLVRSIKLLDWDFLISGRLFLRFPNLIHVDLVNACLISPLNSGIFCTHKSVSFHVDSEVLELGKHNFFDSNFVMNGEEVDSGLKTLSKACPNLRKLAVINATELGLLTLAEGCPSLQELDLLMCHDRMLRGIAAYRNLETLRLTGIVEGFYESLVSDIGLTILAQGCKNLVNLELSGCRGSYEGVKAIGQCCPMLQELSLCNHKMEDGWLLALPFCRSLRTLRLVSCKGIDGSDEVEDEEHLGCCPVVERLFLKKCQVRDRRALRGLLLVCCNVKELSMENCWGMNDDVFGSCRALRRVRSLSLEGCSTLTTHGLESVIAAWGDLQSLKVKSCNNVKDGEVSPTLSGVFSCLKDLQWQPETKAMVSANLDGAGIRKKGSRLFKKACDWKSLPGA